MARDPSQEITREASANRDATHAGPRMTFPRLVSGGPSIRLAHVATHPPSGSLLAPGEAKATAIVRSRPDKPRKTLAALRFVVKSCPCGDRFVGHWKTSN